MAILQGDEYPAELVSKTALDGSTVTLTVTTPDGTTGAPTPVSNPTGLTATIAVPATLLGTYLLVWRITGAVVGVVQDQFTVEAPAPDLMSLPDLRDELNLADPYDIEDAELRRMLRAARGVVENITGAVIPTPKTIAVDGGYPYIVLPDQWVSSITSVTEWSGTTSYALTNQPYGATVDGYGYTWDRNTAIVTRRGFGGTPRLFAPGYGNVSIAYVAGMASIPADIQQATARLIEHWWRKQHSAARSGSSFFGGGSGDDAGTSMVGNYEIPNAAMELLEPWRRSPGIA